MVGMRRIHLASHLTTEELEQRYRQAREPHERPVAWIGPDGRAWGMVERIGRVRARRGLVISAAGHTKCATFWRRCASAITTK